MSRWLGLPNSPVVALPLLHWPHSMQDVHHWRALVPLAVLFGSSVSLKAQITVTYQYTGNPFDVATCVADQFPQQDGVVCASGVIWKNVRARCGKGWPARI